MYAAGTAMAIRHDSRRCCSHQALPGPPVTITSCRRRLPATTAAMVSPGVAKPCTPLITHREVRCERPRPPPSQSFPRLDASVQPPLPPPPPRLPAVMSTQGFECDASHPLIGSGAFAKVLRVRERSTGRSFAVKVMERRFFEVRGIGRLIDQEIAALRRCADHDRCRHVVQLLGVAEEAGHVYLRFELCRSTVLHVVQNRPGCRVAEHEAAVWASQLLTGLGHLHALGILHRDIKPDNLLISMDGTLKVADFGWCAELSDRPTDLAGTFRYMAPEVMARETQTEAVDAWSFGATFLELVTGQPLLSSLPGTGSKGPVLTPLQREVAERCPPLRSSRPPFLSQSCWEVFRSALEPVVSHRISVIAAQQLPWLEAFAASSAASTRAPADAASEDDASSATPPVAPFVQCDDNVWRARGGAPPLTPPAAPVTASASTPSGAEDAAGTRRAPGSAAASPRSWLVLPPPEKCDDLGCPSDRSTATPTPSEPENDTAAADPLRRCASVGPAVMGVTVVTEAPRETPIELDSAPRTPQILHVVLPREPCIRWPPQGVQGAPLVGARARAGAAIVFQAPPARSVQRWPCAAPARIVWSAPLAPSFAW